MTNCVALKDSIIAQYVILLGEKTKFFSVDGGKRKVKATSTKNNEKSKPFPHQGQCLFRFLNESERSSLLKGHCSDILFIERANMHCQSIACTRSFHMVTLTED